MQSSVENEDLWFVLFRNKWVFDSEHLAFFRQDFLFLSKKLFKFCFWKVFLKDRAL